LGKPDARPPQIRKQATRNNPEQILRIPTDRGDGNLLRAQTAAASVAVNVQMRVDEAKMRQARRTGRKRFCHNQSTHGLGAMRVSERAYNCR